MPEPSASTGVLWQRTTLSVIGLLQGVALYFLTAKSETPIDAPAVSPFWAFLWATPTVAMLLLCRASWLKDSIFSVVIGLIAALIFKVSTMLFGIGSDAASLKADDIVGSSTLTAALWGTCFLLFVIPAPFYQAARQARRFAFPYDGLFLNAWTNALVVLVGIGFVIVNWIVLGLWAGLFKLIEINFFADLFGKLWFILPFSGGIFGLGVALSREREAVIQALLRLVTTLFRFLAPILACALLLFLLALPFTGLDALWNTRIASRLILSAIVLFILFENAVIQTGAEQQNFWKPAGIAVMAVNIIMPLLAALAAWAIILRVGQYGWTPLRLYTALAVAVASLYALAYCAACLIGWRSWIDRITRLNPLLALAVLAAAILVHIPPFEPFGLSARDQLARLRDGRTPVKAFDFAYLRFGLGKAGREAFEAIGHDKTLMQDRAVVDAMDVAKRLEKYTENWRGSPALSDATLTELLDVARYIEFVPGHPVPPKAAIEKWIARNKSMLDNCRAAYPPGKSRCWIIDADIDGDGLRAFAGKPCYSSETAIGVSGPSSVPIADNVRRNCNTRSDAATFSSHRTKRKTSSSAASASSDAPYPHHHCSAPSQTISLSASAISAVWNSTMKTRSDRRPSRCLPAQVPASTAGTIARIAGPYCATLNPTSMKPTSLHRLVSTP
jgi:hypothetical protein